jgi:PAS domain S-box-containing protein
LFALVAHAGSLPPAKIAEQAPSPDIREFRLSGAAAVHIIAVDTGASMKTEGSNMAQGHGELDKAALLSAEEREKSVVITNPARPDNPMIFVSDEFEKQTGYTARESLGKNCRFLQGPETDPAAVEAIRAALRDKREITIDILNYRKDGRKFWNRLRIRPLYGDDGKVMFFAGAQNPIPEEEVRKEPRAGTRD